MKTKIVCLSSWTLVFAIAIGGLLLNPLAAAGEEISTKVRVGLASIRKAADVEDGVAKVNEILAKCREQGVQIVCFPET